MISLAGEFTDGKGRHAEGWLFFDADCGFCTRMARWLAPVLAQRRFGVAPLQDSRVTALLDLSGAELLREIRVLLPDDRHYGGAGAIVALAGKVWWARPLVWLSRMPGVMKLLNAGYRQVAARRHCASVACEIAPNSIAVVRRIR
jgi:predicted DCC family thiol-disulfide oxidoreductase YuxK